MLFRSWFSEVGVAQKIYLIDFNQDLRLDIVTLEEKYSSPKVYIFNSKLEKFEKQKRKIFPKGFRSSFLIFDDFNKDGVVDFYSGQFYLNVEFYVPPGQLFKGSKKDLFFQFEPLMNLFPNHRPHSGASIFDINRDGELEFLQTFWMRQSNRGNNFTAPEIKNIKNESYLINEIDNNILKNGAPSWGSEICDINNDNIIDVLIANTSGHENFVLIGSEKNEMQYLESAHKKIGRAHV